MIDDKIAEDILQLDIFSGLPLLGISNLTPMPPTSGGHSCSKFMDAMNVVIRHTTLVPHDRQPVQRGLINDKICVMPSGGGRA